MLSALEVIKISSSAVKRCRFCSAPFLNCDVHWCSPFRNRYITSMLHRGHRGWENFYSYSTTMVYRTSWYQKCIRMAICVAAWPLHLSTGQGLGPAFSGNSILIVLGSLPTPSSSPSCPDPPLAKPLWI